MGRHAEEKGPNPFDATHFELLGRDTTPLVIGVGTRTSRSDRLYGETQLASWAMAHHVHLGSIAKVARSRLTTEKVMQDIPLSYTRPRPC